MTTQPYVKFPRELAGRQPDIEDDDSDTQIAQRVVDEDGPTNQPLASVTSIVKPRAIHALTVMNPHAVEMRPVGHGGHGETLVGMSTPRELTAMGEPVRTRPPTMQQVMQPMPQPMRTAARGTPFKIDPADRPSRVRSIGTPSPVPLFGNTGAVSVQPRQTGLAPFAPAPAQAQAQETILMPHADHDHKLQATVAMVQAPIETHLAVLQGSPYAVQVATPAAPVLANQGAHGVVIGGEITAKPQSKFAEYAEIGLPNPQPSKAAKGAAKLVVSGYRLMGFGILTVIVAVLIGYITQTAFYFVSHSWICPTVISATDDKVIQLNTELAAQQNIRDKLESDMHDAERAAEAEGDFQKEFANAVKADLDGRKVALGHMQALANAAYSTRQKISATNEGYARELATTTQKEYDAGLVDRQHQMTSTFTVAQISDAQLRLQQSEVTFEQQAADLKQQTDALDGLLDAKNPQRKMLSYEVLKMKHDYDVSKVARAKAVENRKMLFDSLARQDKIIAGIKDSAYLRALDDKAVVAQVPYGNLENAKVGTPLYACDVGMVWCHQVGTVGAVLPGEVQFKNPKRDTLIRGQLVELQMTDSDAATEEMLFVGGEPLGF
jgi:hypothetical protein